MSPTALLLGLCLALLASTVYGQCTPVVRKEYRDTTDDEWNLFREALLSLQNLPSTQTSGQSLWDDFATFHDDEASLTHNTPMFFPWHRAFLFKLESTLQGLDPKYASVFIPYWSWSSDWANPPATPLLTQSSSKNLYVPYSSSQKRNRSPRKKSPAAPTPQAPACLVTCHTPNTHCLERSYDPNNFYPYYSSEAMAQIVVGNSDYNTFKNYVEGGPHGQVHVSLGGNYGDLSFMTSPCDPIFFLLHASIDRLWFLWQQLDDSRSTAYEGDINSPIPGFSYTVAQMADYQSACVAYQDYSGDGILGVDALRARASSGAEEPTINSLADVSNCLPAPLSDSWLVMNGFDPAVIRQQESVMHQIVAKTQASNQCASSSSNATGTPVTAGNTTSPTGSQSISITTTLQTIPGWGVGLLVLGATIIVLMFVVVVLVMKSRV